MPPQQLHAIVRSLQGSSRLEPGPVYTAPEATFTLAPSRLGPVPRIPPQYFIRFEKATIPKNIFLYKI